MPYLRLVLADLAREQGPHVELEEGVAAAANGEVRRENGHGPAVPPPPIPGADRSASPGGTGAAYCRTGPSPDGGGSSSPGSPDGGVAGGVSATASSAPGGGGPAASSSSPTVFVALPSGRRRPRRSAATRRSRKMIVWPVMRSRITTANRRRGADRLGPLPGDGERRQDDEDAEDDQLEPEAAEAGATLRVEVVALVLDRRRRDRHEREGYGKRRAGAEAQARRRVPRPRRRVSPNVRSAGVTGRIGPVSCRMTVVRALRADSRRSGTHSGPAAHVAPVVRTFGNSRRSRDGNPVAAGRVPPT